MAITYEETKLHNTTLVKLDGTRAGFIRQDENGFAYYPASTPKKGGDYFRTLDGCKRSLETEDDAELVLCPQCDGIAGNCNGYCDETGEVTRASANEWHRQND